MAMKERQTGRRLFRRRFAVLRRPPIEHIGDVDLGSIKTDRAKHAIKQLAGTADEWESLQILVAAGRFADQHDSAQRRTVGEHRVCGMALQLAAVEITERGLELA